MLSHALLDPVFKNSFQTSSTSQ